MPPAIPSENPYRDEVAEPVDESQPFRAASSNPYAAPVATATSAFDFAARLKLASRSLRFAGAILDSTIYGIGTIPALSVMAMADANNDDILQAFGTLMFMGGLLLVGIGNWVLITRSGQSFAKRLLGMRIVRENGQLPGFLHGVFLRHWVLSFFCICYPVGILVYLIDGLIIFGGKRQCLHDLMAGTLVVKVT